jgi:hypothetical protein
MVLDLQTSVRCLVNMLVLSLAFLLGSVLTDPGTSENFPEPPGSPVCVTRGFQTPEPPGFDLGTSGLWADGMYSSSLSSPLLTNLIGL